MSINVSPTVRRTLSERVGMEIKIALLRSGMSGRQLATKLGVSQTWVSSRLQGATPIDLNDLERIAEVLGININDLFPSPPRAYDQHREVRVTYPVAAGPGARPIARGGHSTTSTRPPTFGQRSDGRKINNRPAGHPIIPLRTAA